MKRLTFAVTLALLCALSSPAAAATWVVPDDFITIEAALADAGVVDGERVKYWLKCGAQPTERVKSILKVLKERKAVQEGAS